MATQELTPTLGSDALLPIPINTLLASRGCDLDLYHNIGRGKFSLYRDHATPFEPADLAKLVQAGVTTLYIRREEQDAYTKHLQEEVLGNGGLSPKERYEVLRTATQSAFEQAYCGGTAQLTELTGRFSRQLTDTLCDKEFLFRDMLGLMCHDYSIFNHAMNVSTYCVIVALRMGESSKQALTQIAAGGLLHDLGKRIIPRAVLHKPGPLTDEERDLVRRHPVTGFELLSRQDEAEWGQLMMVYQHHERPDGRGYPVGIPSAEIHPWARLCAVADTWENMTSDRPYRKALPVPQALEALSQRGGGSLDSETVQCLVRMVQES